MIVDSMENNLFKPSDSEGSEQEYVLLRYLLVLARNKKVVFFVTVIVMLLSYAVTFLSPSIFRAELKLLPPQDNSIVSRVLEPIGSLSGVVGVKNGMDLYRVMLVSDVILGRVVASSHLEKVYGAGTMREAIEKLRKKMIVKTEKEGYIYLAVDDASPTRAADLANRFPHALQIFTNGLALTKSARKRLFLEKELGRIDQVLAVSEKNMERFRKKTGILNMEEQTAGLVGSITELKKKIAERQIEFEVVKTYAQAGNPERQLMDKEIEEQKKQLSTLENMAKGISKINEPDLQTEYFQTLRAFRHYEGVKELVSNQYDLAKLDEAQEPVFVQVLEPASPPENRWLPKRKEAILSGFLFGLVFSCLLVFLKEYMGEMWRDPRNADLVLELKKSTFA